MIPGPSADSALRHLPSRPAFASRVLALGGCLFAGFRAALLSCSTVAAQEREAPTLRLGGVVPAGVRASATEAWGAFDFDLHGPLVLLQGRLRLAWPVRIRFDLKAGQADPVHHLKIERLAQEWGDYFRLDPV